MNRSLSFIQKKLSLKLGLSISLVVAIIFMVSGSITLTCSQDEDGIVSFAVSDTGISIAECDRERIFTPFTKVSYFTEGVGLGLSLSKQIAQKLGGDLILDNSYQGGSRFVLTLKA